MSNEYNPYWLCCGSTDLFQHRNCTEHLMGYPERRRFGTAEEHRVWLEEQRKERETNRMAKEHC